jgi:uncharacterized protein YdeI (YjbR/CyaY-like superfamily)
MFGDAMTGATRLKFFRKPADFRKWLEQNHLHAGELWVGFHKKGSQKPSITWPESVDQALCFGWIDGLRKNVDELSYCIRFSPRKPTSIWSAVNIKRAQELGQQKLMQAAGLKAFAARRENKSGIYAYEQRVVTLHEPYESLLKAEPAAWEFFYAQAPSYRKVAIWRIVSAKQEATRMRRLDTLIKASAEGRRIDELTPRKPAATTRKAKSPA